MFIFNLALGLIQLAVPGVTTAVTYQSGQTNIGFNGSVSPTASLESNTNTNARILDFLSIGIFSKIAPILDYMDKAFFGLPVLITAIFEGTASNDFLFGLGFFLRSLIGMIYAFAVISLWTGRNLFDE